MGANVTILAGVTIGPRGVRGRGQRGDRRRAPAHPGGGGPRAGGPRLLMDGPTREPRTGAAPSAAARGRRRPPALRAGPPPAVTAFFFRDLSAYFFPLRLFVLQGLLRGRAPLLEPLHPRRRAPHPLPALGYPPDLLQLLLADGGGALRSCWLLHVPLAALGAMALARRLRLGPRPGRGRRRPRLHPGRLRPLHRQPLRVRAGPGLGAVPDPLPAAGAATRRPARHRAGRARDRPGSLDHGRRRSWPRPSLLGLAAGLPAGPPVRGPPRLAISLGLGLGRGRVTFPWARSSQAARGTRVRDRGGAGPLRSPHDLGCRPSWPGSTPTPAASPRRFWGQNFFPRGFPYFLSLYLGALGVGLGLCGAASGSPHRHDCCSPSLLRRSW